jgi:predicted O-methyltransferase YrrM
MLVNIIRKLGNTMENLKNKKDEEFYNCEYTDKILSAKEHFDNLYKVCNGSFVDSWGSYLFNGREYQYDIDTFEKQKLLFDVAKSQSSVLEIGVYMGHSLLIMLLANPSLTVTCIDIDPTYSKPATDYLKTVFPNASINFVCGNSLEVLPLINNKFDMFHIDGTHKNKIITQEFNYCLNLTKLNTFIVIFDDIEKCETLESSIKSNFIIHDYKRTSCKWPNSYLKISKK